MENKQVTPGKIVKIVITGGPCAGKTTLMSKALQELGDLGVKVLIVPEAATTLIAGMHITPGNFGMTSFQKYILDHQFAAEAIVDHAATEQAADGSNVVILCDRGKLDGAAYAGLPTISELLAEHGSNPVETLNSYDMVVHLVTAANGAEEAYTLSNNAARSETPEEARQLDVRTLAAWTGHSHVAIIGNHRPFHEKIASAIQAIYGCLGIPVPVERERKFLARMPDLAALINYNPVISKIVQTYLPNSGNTERRIRQRGDGVNFSFFYTEKTELPEMTDHIERESLISPRQYAAYLAQSVTAPVRKTRCCFPYQNQYMEMDIYAGESRFVTIEVEGLEASDKVFFPPEIEVIKEITGDKRYSNRAIAENGGSLPIAGLDGGGGIG